MILYLYVKYSEHEKVINLDKLTFDCILNLRLKNKDCIRMVNLSDLLKSEDLTFSPVNYYLQTFDKTHQMIAHSHDYFEIMYADSGYFFVSYKQGETVKRLTVNEGQFIIIGNGIIHKMEIPLRCRIYNFEFKLCESTGKILNFYRCLQETANVRVLFKNFKGISVISDRENVLDTLKLLHFSLQNNKNDVESAYLIQSQILSLLINIGRCFTHIKSETRSIYVIKMLKIINEDFSKHLSPKLFAADFHVSESYLQRLFKQNVGQSIIEYINSKRLEQAKFYLEKTDMPIIDIAVSVGFNTRQNFIQLFKKNTGLSPSQYRKAEKNQAYDIPIEPGELSKQKSYTE